MLPRPCLKGAICGQLRMVFGCFGCPRGFGLACLGSWLLAAVPWSSMLRSVGKLCQSNRQNNAVIGNREDDWWMFPNDFWISQRNARAAGSGGTVKISWVLCAGHLRVYAGMMRNFFRSTNSDVVIQIKPMKTWWHANSACVSHVSSCILDVDQLLLRVYSSKCAGSFVHYFLLMHHPALCRQKSSDPCSKDVILYLNTRISPWSVSVETFYDAHLKKLDFSWREDVLGSMIGLRDWRIHLRSPFASCER